MIKVLKCLQPEKKISVAFKSISLQEALEKYPNQE